MGGTFISQIFDSIIKLLFDIIFDFSSWRIITLHIFWHIEIDSFKKTLFIFSFIIFISQIFEEISSFLFFKFSFIIFISQIFEDISKLFLDFFNVLFWIKLNPQLFDDINNFLSKLFFKFFLLFCTILKWHILEEIKRLLKLCFKYLLLIILFFFSFWIILKLHILYDINNFSKKLFFLFIKSLLLNNSSFNFISLFNWFITCIYLLIVLLYSLFIISLLVRILFITFLNSSFSFDK